MPCNFITMAKTYQQINERIKNGEAVVLTAEEVSQLALTMSPEEIADKVDVVTTGTFGAMCSSGAFINFGHSDPPIRMERIELNGVGVSGGLAAVDTYIGATDCNPANPEYGGAHIIEDFINGKDILLEAWGKGTDCYPRRHIRTYINRDTVNEAYLYNPRNAYQNYNVATNTSDRTIHTYMGTLLPKMKNASYSTSGELSPPAERPGVPHDRTRYAHLSRRCGRVCGVERDAVQHLQGDERIRYPDKQCPHHRRHRRPA